MLQTVSETPCLTSQVRATSQTAEQERSLNDQSLQLLRDDLARVKQSLSDCQRREGSVCLLITYCMTLSGCKLTSVFWVLCFPFVCTACTKRFQCSDEGCFWPFTF